MNILETNLKFTTTAKNHSFFYIKKITTFLGVSACLLTHSYALTSGKMTATIFAGANVVDFDRLGQIVFPPETFRTDTFQSSGTNINFVPAIGLSYDIPLESSKLNPGNIFKDVSLGINVYYNENSRDGSVYEYSLASFNNSIYSMRAQSSRMMFDTEWALSPITASITPFFEAGFGLSQVTTSFINTPRPDIGADGGNYRLTNHSTNLTYEVGSGIKAPLNEHFMVSARYLFTQATNGESATYDGNTGVQLARPIKIGVGSQSVLFGLSYLFG